jgi:hypothetical protein
MVPLLTNKKLLLIKLRDLPKTGGLSVPELRVAKPLPYLLQNLELCLNQAVFTYSSGKSVKIWAQ